MVFRPVTSVKVAERIIEDGEATLVPLTPVQQLCIAAALRFFSESLLGHSAEVRKEDLNYAGRPPHTAHLTLIHRSAELATGFTGLALGNDDVHLDPVVTAYASAYPQRAQPIPQAHLAEAVPPIG